MNTKSVTPAVATPTRAIFFDGPFSKADHKGERDESPYWTVYQVNSFKRAENLAQAMSIDRKLELVADAMPA
jgi:hypothetical protein